MARSSRGDLGLVVRTSGMESAQLVNLCAPCHSRRAELGDYDHASTELLDYMLPALLREGLYHADGQILDEVYVYGSFVQSKMYANDVRCTDCHDAHSLLLVRDGNELCGQCHEAAAYDTPEHHFHKLEVDGLASDGALCIKCHMVEQPFMVIDWRADHSLRIPRPDLSAELGTPNACTQSRCHDDRPLQWSVDAYTKWYGEARRPHFATTFAAARTGDRSALIDLSRIVESPLQPALVRATALEMLSVGGAESTAQLCASLLLDEEPILRQAAVTHLRPANPEEEVQLLAPLLADPVKAIRLAASSRLASVDTELLEEYQRQDLESGLREYRRTMESSLDFASSALNLGALAARQGDPAEAERYLRIALQVDDRFMPARANLAILLAGQGRDDEAEQLLRKGVQLAPDDAEPWRMIGLLLASSSDPSRAIVPMETALQLDPRDARTHYNLGLLLQQLGRPDEAEAHLRAALELEPDSPDCLYALADHYLKRGLYDRVLPLADRLSQLLPDQAIGPQLRAIAERGGN